MNFLKTYFSITDIANRISTFGQEKFFFKKGLILKWSELRYQTIKQTVFCKPLTHFTIFGSELSSDQYEIQQLARKFAREEILPVAAHHDKTGEFPSEIVKKAHQLGLINHHISTEFGMHSFVSNRNESTKSIAIYISITTYYRRGRTWLVRIRHDYGRNRLRMHCCRYFNWCQQLSSTFSHILIFYFSINKILMQFSKYQSS